LGWGGVEDVPEEKAENMNKRSVSLKSITVKGLFGTIDYYIPLDQSSPTVLTGANGTGKSTILRLVHAASVGNMSVLAAAPLQELALEIVGAPNFMMRRSELDRGFHLTWGDRVGSLVVSEFFRELPEWAVSGLEERQYDAEALLEDLAEVAGAVHAPFEEYRDARDALTRAERSGPILHGPDWLDELGEAFKVLFVTDQRLVTESRTKARSNSSARVASTRTTHLAVEAASIELAALIREADSDYARSSQQLDRQLPQRLLKAMTKPRAVSNDGLMELLQDAAGKREALRQVGLLDVDPYEPALSLDSLQDENVRRVMDVVITSTLDKLSVLEDLARRLTSFKAFLDDRFAPKKLELDRRHGMRFNVRNKQSVRPRQLSSGEQQMTVLAFEILFRAKEGTLVIIDEPELSLHVLWQDTLMRDLESMGEAAGVQFLLATHSPVILAHYPQLERPLKSIATKK
jgi:predicted ATPase